MRHRCRHSRPESRASAWHGRIRIPVAMERWFRVLPISRTGCNAELTLTPSISTVSRRSLAATLVAIRTEPGPRWGNGSAIPAEASIGHRFHTDAREFDWAARIGAILHDAGRSFTSRAALKPRIPGLAK